MNKELREEYEKETGKHFINTYDVDAGETDFININYVEWLEQQNTELKEKLNKEQDAHIKSMQTNTKNLIKSRGVIKELQKENNRLHSLVDNLLKKTK